MNFKEIRFNDSNATRIYTHYISGVKNSIKNLNKSNQNEILMEINSHIYEGLHASDKPEVEGLLDVIEKLGNPEIYLNELVAEKQLEEAAKSFNPIKIFKALILNLTNGFSYVIFFLLYLSLFSFVYLIIMKIIKPKEVGFFYNEDGSFVLGLSHQNYEQHEQLGHWFIPLMAGCAILLFLLITLLLQVKKLINKK